MYPCVLIYSTGVARLDSAEKPERTGVFLAFSKKGILKGYFDLFFDRDEQSKKNLLHYKPYPLKSLSRRKSWKYLLYLSKKSSLYFSVILPIIINSFWTIGV
jgi:hypothetical protein